MFESFQMKESWGNVCIIFFCITIKGKAKFILESQVFFHGFLACSFLFFEVMDLYQNTIMSDSGPWVEKRVQLQERFTLMIHESICYLKMLCMGVLSLSGGMESKWITLQLTPKHYKKKKKKKMLAFQYKSSLKRIWLLG